MIKTFIAGVLLGVAAVGAALYFIPVVDQTRESSLINVIPNVGNEEVFHANIPTDRIMIGAPKQATPLPVGLDWPDDALLADSRAELFKIRNARDAVVGVASRIAASSETGELVEWVLHLPARGSVYLLMQSGLQDGGMRLGALRAGTHEFADLRGEASEQWIADTSGADDAPAGRIELRARFASIGGRQSQ
ncbi:MAG: hypothetical protein OEW64_03760 [Gammaproteobacteria bacterium]|nr:hypothetical protein [Gammaproteobacteria bacterium]MDH5303194.1 hypothetical protein [Gammaproteobacteria bacterium]MDH5320798.1 hypothetical protein [Gammaproteobacteria bacterium]